MELYRVVCLEAGCPNGGLRTEIEHEGFPTNVTCGACGRAITEITAVNG